MEVTRVRALRGPNLWSHHTSIEAIVTCSPEEESIGALPGFETRLRALFPQIWPLQPTGHDDTIPLAQVLEVAALALQGLLLATKLERWEEAVVIAIFHVVGTLMELFKTAHGSWIYPEPSLLRLGGVPLFSGFMYACIGSYLARAWRLFELRFVAYPPLWAPWLLAVLAYLNFFTHHYMPDFRVGLYAMSIVIFGRAWFVFTPDRKPRRMPMLLGFVLVALFIWFAENLGTFASAWIYPSQRHGWSLVPITKLGAWYLLMMLSFVLVSLVHRPEAAEADAELAPAQAV